MCKLLADFSQHGVVVGLFVVADGSPIHGFRSAGRVQVLVNNIAVQSLRIGPFFVGKGDPPQRHLQLGSELFSRKVSLNTKTLNSGAIKEQDSGRPQHVEAMEVRWRLFNVDGNGQEILINRTGQLLVSIRFGFQPNACASSRGSAKIQQNCFATVPGFA